MKRPNPEVVDNVWANKSLKAISHFPRGLVRERDAEQTVGRNPVFCE
jgi:hypothetical protein